jgi:PII-like signaling protein
MKLSGEGKLLRIFIGEADRIDHRPMHDVIVEKAHSSGMAGATVLRGVEGFGPRSRTIHTSRILRLSEDLPIIIEIVDTEEHIREFLPIVDECFERSGCGGLVTIERAEVMKYTPGR